MYISVTERQTYMRCRRKWDYGSANRRGLVRLGASAPPLELGGLIHKTLAQWLIDPDLESNPAFERSLGNVFMTFAAARLEELKRQYKQVVGAEISDDELDPLYDSILLGKAMMENYQAYYKQPLSDNMKFAAAEQEVQVPIPGTEHYLRATFDGLIQDERGYLYVLEHKTYGRRPRIENLHTNDQFTGYTWAANQLNVGPVVGVAYDGMWKRATVPKRNEREDLFLRTTIRKPQEELDEWGRHLTEQALEMSDPNIPIYPNRRWEGCSDCGYQTICTAQSRGEPVEDLIKLTYTTRELTQASPDGVDRVRGVRVRTAFPLDDDDDDE